MDRYQPARRPPAAGTPEDEQPTRAAPPIDDRPTQAVPPVERPQAPASQAPTQAARAQPAATKAAPVQVRRLRRGRLAIRKFSPWATFKFSLVFYFCMLLILLLGSSIIFATLKAFGVVENIERLLRDLDFDVTISGGIIFRWFFLLGLAGTVVASAITVFMAFLYNLIADVVGGIEMLVTERE